LTGRVKALTDKVVKAVVGVINDGKKDFGAGLTYPEQILASQTISNSVVTPSDNSTTVQMIQNPLKPLEMISVQLVC
jgi:hypothetical protein